MKWSGTSRMINIGNDYSKLKWPITFASVLTTTLALILILSFRSNSWFTYEIIYRETNSSQSVNRTNYAKLLEYGSVGLWKTCVGHYDEAQVKCDPWTRETRPQSFDTLIILVACALFLSNLTVFPSWAASILILYNTNNRYIRSMFSFILILFILTIAFTVLLLVAMLVTSFTRFYSPGVFTLGSQHIFFQTGLGFFYASFGLSNDFLFFINKRNLCLLATFLALLSLVFVISALISKKIIDIRLAETERELLKQMSDDNYRPGWHRMVIAPRTPMSDEETQPPPYESNRK